MQSASPGVTATEDASLCRAGGESSLSWSQSAATGRVTSPNIVYIKGGRGGIIKKGCVFSVRVGINLLCTY